MTGIAWLVLVLSALIPLAFVFGRKVEREIRRNRLTHNRWP